MSAVEKLEALINIEDNLKSQYEDKLAAAAKKEAELAQKIQELETTVSSQVAKIAELSLGNADTKRLEQTNRELTNRCDKLQVELESHKSKAKVAQKEANALKSEVKDLKQLDAEKIKKNLVATKKKLDEKTEANNLLSKSLKDTKTENAKLQKELAEVKAELESLKPAEESQEETAEA